jgi:hypothetical protein
MDTSAPSWASRTLSYRPPPDPRPPIGSRGLPSRGGRNPLKSPAFSRKFIETSPRHAKKTQPPLQCSGHGRFPARFAHRPSRLRVTRMIPITHNRHAKCAYVKYASVRKRPRPNPNPNISSISASIRIIGAARRLFPQHGNARDPCSLVFMRLSHILRLCAYVRSSWHRPLHDRERQCLGGAVPGGGRQCARIHVLAGGGLRDFVGVCGSDVACVREPWPRAGCLVGNLGKSALE